jgi:hypothetical protein
VRDRLELPVANWDDYYKGEFYSAKSNANVKSHRLLAALRRDATGQTRIIAINLEDASLAVSADLVVLKTSAKVIRAAENEARRIPPGGANRGVRVARAWLQH